MELEPQEETVLQALVGRLLVPNEEAAKGDWKAAVAVKVVTRLAADADTGERFLAGLRSLAQESWMIFGYAFVDLPGGQQDELLSRVENENVRGQWGGCPPADFIKLLVDVTDGAAKEIEGAES